MPIKVYRNSFFKTHGKSHRFTETSPYEPSVDQCICCCTDSVSIRPEGEPDSISQGISMVGDECGMPYKFELSSSHFTHIWKYEGESRPHLQFSWEHYGKKEHVYYTVNHNHIYGEMHIPNYGYVNYIFFKLFKGPGDTKDINHLMNGHSPPSIIDPKTISHDQLWLYGCSWGDEATRMMPENDEARQWRIMMATAESIQRKAKEYDKFNISVDAIREQVELDSCLLELSNMMVNYLAKFTVVFKASHMYRLTREIDIEIGRSTEAGVK